MNERRSRIFYAKAHAPALKKGQRKSQIISPGIPVQIMEGDSVLNAKRLLMNNGIDLSNLSVAQIVSFGQQNPAVQQKSIDIYRRNRSMNEERET